MMELKEFEDLINGLSDDFFSIYSVPTERINFVKNNTLRLYQSIVEGGRIGIWFMGQKYDMAALYRAKVCADLIRMAKVKCQILQDKAAEEEYYIKLF